MTEGKTLRVPLSELVEERQNADPANHTLERAEREHIIRALRECIGLVSGPTGAAHRLGLTFFCAFSTEVLGSLDVSSRHSVLPAGSVLFVEGQMRRVVFVLCSGGVQALNGGTLVIRNRTACKP